MQSIDPFNYAELLLDALGDKRRFLGVYNDWAGAILNSPIWSRNRVNGRRFHWRDIAEARNAFLDQFSSPGVYLFGTSSGVPRYIGSTGGKDASSACKESLGERLSDRYTKETNEGSIPTQCHLAAECPLHLKQNRIKHVYKWIGKWLDDASNPRLFGALDFAIHGIDGIWIAILPVQDPASVLPLEKWLIPAGENWNRQRQYPSLVNVHYIDDWG